MRVNAQHIFDERNLDETIAGLILNTFHRSIVQN